MAEHYYSAKPASAHDRQQFQTVLRGRELQFTTDAGVFSRNAIDFGTQLLIREMDIAPEHRVLDVGCGYGPIGIAAAGIAVRGRVTMVDMNERAVQLSRENAERNGLHNITVLQSNLCEQVADQTFDRVLTNPPIRAGKEIVHAIFHQAYQVLAEQGQLWIVIQKKQGAPSAFAKLQSIFPDVVEVAKEKGYRIIKAAK